MVVPGLAALSYEIMRERAARRKRLKEDRNNIRPIDQPRYPKAA